MEKLNQLYFYNADIGCCAIACGQSIIRIPNGYGDGTFKVYVLDRGEYNAYVEEHKKYGIEEKAYHEVMYSNFKEARILNHDCTRVKQIEANTLFIINGTYSVYCNYGKVYFVKEKEF